MERCALSPKISPLGPEPKRMGSGGWIEWFVPQEGWGGGRRCGGGRRRGGARCVGGSVIEEVWCLSFSVKTGKNDWVP